MKRSLGMYFLILIAILLCNYEQSFAVVAGTPEDGNPIDITPTPFPPPVTPVPTPTPSLVCEYNRVTARWNLGEAPHRFLYTASNTQAAPCIIEAFREVHRQCVAYETNKPGTMGYRMVGAIDWQNVDNCVAWRMFKASWYATSGPGGYGQMATGYGPRHSWSNAANNTRGKSYYSGSYYYDADLSSNLYIRQDAAGVCTAVSSSSIPTGERICLAGNYNWYISPISILLDENTDIDRDLHIVKFPLNPKNPGHWVIWKASAKAPLLVYDPEHTGRVTSAQQLFGNWSFGGKKQASTASHAQGLATVSMKAKSDEETAMPWANGYEVLASLDINADGKVSEAELAPLALWFDNNRDGVSQEGEIKRIEEVGISALFYQISHVDQKTKSIFADKGYERTLNGKKTIGRSVDWLSDTAETKAELINKHLGNVGSCKVENHNSADKSLTNAEPNTNVSAAEVVSQTELAQNELNLSGIWQWRSEDTAGNPEGFFGFSDDVSGSIKGHVYSAFHTDTTSAKFSDILSAFFFVGNKTMEKNGAVKIKFTVKPDETSVLENEAIFFPKEQKIVGKTIAKVSAGMKALDLTYSWVATRLEVQ